MDDIRNMLTLSLFDPAGWRGSGHRHGTWHDITIGPATASPGYLAGPLPPGAWQVVVDTHMIMPGTPCTIRVDIATSAAAVEATAVGATGSRPPAALRAPAFPIATADPATAVPETPRRGRGWYRGDLHAHSIHSDAAWDIPDLLAWSRKRGLDFAALSDHNTISGLAQMDASSHVHGDAEGNEPSAGQDLLPMGGMEFTTYWGHALALGIRQWVDWRVTLAPGQRVSSPPSQRISDGVTPDPGQPDSSPPSQRVGDGESPDPGQPDSSLPSRRVGDGESPTSSPISRAITQLPAEVAALGGLFIIAHPMAVGDPYCTGCQWRYPDMMPGTATAVEVWNSDWRGESRNERGLSLAYEWLNAGHRLALTAGTDNHGRNPDAMHYGFNVVYAADCTEQEILRAVRAGHLYLSSGPTLSLAAEAGARRAGMGDVLDVANSQIVAVTEGKGDAGDLANSQNPAATAGMGDMLPAAGGQTVEVTATWGDCPAGAEARLVVDGQPLSAIPASEQGSHTWTLPPGAHWCLLTLRAADGLMLALTNPIFITHKVE